MSLDSQTIEPGRDGETAAIIDDTELDRIPQPLKRDTNVGRRGMAAAVVERFLRRAVEGQFEFGRPINGEELSVRIQRYRQPIILGCFKDQHLERSDETEITQEGRTHGGADGAQLVDEHSAKGSRVP